MEQRARLEQLDPFQELGVAQAAGGALAAGLVHEEFQEVLQHVQHVPLRAEDDDRAAGGDVLEGEVRPKSLAGTHWPEAPPICTALASSPPTSLSSWATVMPRGNS